MANIVVLGAGLGGTLMAYELKAQLGENDTLTVVGQGRIYHFVPSNPWVAVDWRKREAIEVDLAPVFPKKKIDFVTCGAKRLKTASNLRMGRRLHTTISSSRQAPISLLTRSKILVRKATRTRYVMSIMRRKRSKRFRRSSRPRDRSSWAPRRARHASDPLTSSPLFSIPNCGAGRSVTACR